MAENGQNDLNLVITEERLNDVDLETFYFLETNPKAMIDFVAFFVAGDDGEYLDQMEAVRRVIKGRKVKDIAEIATDLRDAMEKGIVPNQ